VQVS
jgi:hypothetical protein